MHLVIAPARTKVMSSFSVPSEPFSIDIDPSFTFRQVKEKIAQRINIPLSDQFLSCDGRTLEDDHVLGSYDNIKDGSTLWMVISSGDFRQTSVYLFQFILLTMMRSVKSSN